MHTIVDYEILYWPNFLYRDFLVYENWRNKYDKWNFLAFIYLMHQAH